VASTARREWTPNTRATLFLIVKCVGRFSSEKSWLISWLMLADICKKLAVKLADTWLLIDNSQVPHNPLKPNRNPLAEFQHFSQKKISWLLYQPGTASNRPERRRNG